MAERLTTHGATDDHRPLVAGSTQAGRRRFATAGVILAGFALLVVRRLDGLLDPYLWAEDGTLLLPQAVDGVAHLFEPYAGQLLVGNRMLASGVVALPAQAWPLAAYVVACLVASIALAAVLLERAEPLFGGFWRRVVLYAALVLLPAAWEAQGNLANIQVWLGIGMLVLLTLDPPARRSWRAVELGGVVLACLTGFLGLILLPAAIWKWVHGRSRFLAVRMVTVAAGAAVNVVVAVASGRAGAMAPQEWPVATVVLVVKRTAGALLLGENGLAAWWPQRMSLLWVIPSLALLAGVAVLAWRDRSGPSPWWLVSGLVWLLLGMVSVTGAWYVAAGLGSPYYAGRYVCLAIAAVVLVIARSLRSPGSGLLAAVLAVACCGGLLGGAVILKSPGDEPRAVDPRELDRFAGCLEQSISTPCELAIGPEGWTMTVPKPADPPPG